MSEVSYEFRNAQDAQMFCDRVNAIEGAYATLPYWAVARDYGFWCVTVRAPDIEAIDGIYEVCVLPG